MHNCITPALGLNKQSFLSVESVSGQSSPTVRNPGMDYEVVFSGRNIESISEDKCVVGGAQISIVSPASQTGL